jgi:SM-20-related protein
MAGAAMTSNPGLDVARPKRCTLGRPLGSQVSVRTASPEQTPASAVPLGSRPASPLGLALEHDAIVALGDGRALVFDAVLGASVAAGVRAAALDLLAAGQLRPAGIGRQAAVQLDTRGDFITWIDPDQAPPSFTPVVELLLALMGTLNQAAYLGARTLELQLAVYTPGFGYARHRDSLLGTDQRRATVIYYANDWQPGDGGELELVEDGEVRIVAPIADRVVVFRSDVVEHAVLPVARGPRVALSGWLRREG